MEKDNILLGMRKANSVALKTKNNNNAKLVNSK